MRLALLALAASSLLIGCYGAGGDVSGEVRVTDSPLGSWTQKLDACHSGQLQGFFGVDIGRSSDESIFVRVVDDPIEGIRVLLRAPGGDDALLVTPAICEGLEGRIEPTNTFYNDVRLLDGSLRAECEIDDRTRIQVNVEFEGCH